MEKFGNIGFKLTPQRLAILKSLEGDTTHPSADEIYGRVKEAYPTMSFATVYNTLDALRQRGHVAELFIDPRRRRYDPNTKPHHHFMCVVCGKIMDIHETFDLTLSESVKGRFRIIGSHVEFHGVCPECDTHDRRKEVD